MYTAFHNPWTHRGDSLLKRRTKWEISHLCGISFLRFSLDEGKKRKFPISRNTIPVEFYSSFFSRRERRKFSISWNTIFVEFHSSIFSWTEKKKISHFVEHSCGILFPIFLLEQKEVNFLIHGTLSTWNVFSSFSNEFLHREKLFEIWR